MLHDPSPDSQPINLRRKIYELILDQKDRLQCLPTQDDIRRLFGDLTDDVDLHLRQLAREGLLILDRNGGNGISLVPTYVQLPEVGLLGKVAQGFAGQGGCNPRGSIGLDLRGCGVPMEPGMQWVQVLDDRMSDAGIEFGDIALVVNSLPTRGCIVAIEESDVVVLRRYVVISGIPHFLAANPNSPELSPAWNADIQGVLWGLIKIEARRQPNQPRQSPQSKESKGPIRKLKEPQARFSRRSPDWPNPPTEHQLNEPRACSAANGCRTANAATRRRQPRPSKLNGRKG